ncbi:MAG: hypothetical protein KBS52_07610 [Clostridiales bacterium]|nr:hypothetical protein [Candidatus Equinaster intestinalis]
MRNGKHYVAVRMTPTEKRRFLEICNLCKVPERTVFYRLVDNMIVNQRAPDSFYKLTRLLSRLQTNVSHIWLSNNMLPEDIKNKYYNFEQELNKLEREIFFKGAFADPYYGVINRNKK